MPMPLHTLCFHRFYGGGAPAEGPAPLPGQQDVMSAVSIAPFLDTFARSLPSPFWPLHTGAKNKIEIGTIRAGNHAMDRQNYAVDRQTAC